MHYVSAACAVCGSTCVPPLAHAVLPGAPVGWIRTMSAAYKWLYPHVDCERSRGDGDGSAPIESESNMLSTRIKLVRCVHDPSHIWRLAHHCRAVIMLARSGHAGNTLVADEFAASFVPNSLVFPSFIQGFDYTHIVYRYIYIYRVDDASDAQAYQFSLRYVK